MSRNRPGFNDWLPTDHPIPRLSGDEMEYGLPSAPLWSMIFGKNISGYNKLHVEFIPSSILGSTINQWWSTDGQRVLGRHAHHQHTVHVGCSVFDALQCGVFSESRFMKRRNVMSMSRQVELHLLLLHQFFQPWPWNTLEGDPLLVSFGIFWFFTPQATAMASPCICARSGPGMWERCPKTVKRDMTNIMFHHCFTSFSMNNNEHVHFLYSFNIFWNSLDIMNIRECCWYLLIQLQGGDRFWYCQTAQSVRSPWLLGFATQFICSSQTVFFWIRFVSHSKCKALRPEHRLVLFYDAYSSAPVFQGGGGRACLKIRRASIHGMAGMAGYTWACTHQLTLRDP